MKQNNFDRQRFRELLRKGIGFRTQKEFATQTGIASETLSRMLNDNNSPRPKTRTLEVLAANMENVMLSELLAACGYEVPTLDAAVLEIESDISDFFAFKSDSLDVYKNMDELLSKLKLFIRRSINDIEADYNTEIEIPDTLISSGVEDACVIRVSWIHDALCCITSFSLFYIETKKGSIVVCGTNIDEVVEKRGYIRHTRITKKHASDMEERLLKAIFGDKDAVAFSSTLSGFGFECDGTPEKFVDFLHEHATTFCDTAENIILYNRIVEGEDPDVVFDDFERSDCGPLSAIAYIMSKESGRNYCYYEKDRHLAEDEQNSCIMVSSEDDDPNSFSDRDFIYAYNCAKTLGIPIFGDTCYKTTSWISLGRVFNTEKSWIDSDLRFHGSLANESH